MRIKYMLFAIMHVWLLQSADTKKIELHDCFEIKQIEVAGAPLFYAPVFGGRVHKEFNLSNLFSRQSLNQPVRLRGCLGFVSGPNKKLVERIAERVKGLIFHYEKDNDEKKCNEQGIVLPNEGLLSEDYLCKALSEEDAPDAQVLQNASALCLRLFRFRCSAENRSWQFISPSELSMRGQDENGNSFPWLPVYSRRSAMRREERELNLFSNKPIIPAPDALNLLVSMNSVALQCQAPSECFKILDQHATTQCLEVDLSHHAPVMVFKGEIFIEYLAQLFGTEE